MPPRKKTVLRQRIFEARYEQGYRYLDRCGDAMIILENLLSKDTGHLWLPEQMSPVSARLQCPDLDITIVFDAYHFIIDQNSTSEIECDFAGLAEVAFATITGRFDLRKRLRFGYRRIKLMPADSIEGAEALSVTRLPLKDWRKKGGSTFEPRHFGVDSVFELPDRSKGARVRAGLFFRAGTEVKVDERLRFHPHQLPADQHEVLMEQLRRKRKREHDPDAGLSIDIDYYMMHPPTDWAVQDFLREAEEEADRLEEDLLARREA